MAGRKSDFTLTKLDDLFTTQAQRDEEQLSKIRDIPLELIDDFPDHPFKVRDLQMFSPMQRTKKKPNENISWKVSTVIRPLPVTNLFQSSRHMGKRTAYKPITDI